MFLHFHRINNSSRTFLRLCSKQSLPWKTYNYVKQVVRLQNIFFIINTNQIKELTILFWYFKRTVNKSVFLALYSHSVPFVWAQFGFQKKDIFKQGKKRLKGWKNQILKIQATTTIYDPKEIIKIKGKTNWIKNMGWINHVPCRW